jgi:hypothetical protein
VGHQETTVFRLSFTILMASAKIEQPFAGRTGAWIGQR